MYNRYRSFGTGFFISRVNLVPVLRNTHGNGMQREILKVFGTPQKVNFMELFSVLISYSSSPIEEKIKLLLYVFDFDGSGKITRDEMVILIGAFIRGVA